MPKRKRDSYGDDRGITDDRPMIDIEGTLESSKQLLYKALKLAKGFERQKLGQRLQDATKAGKTEEVTRRKREIAVLKDLDLRRAGDAYLCKTLLKIKTLERSGRLPQEVKDSVQSRGAGMLEEDRLAWGNVTSGMFNMKGVREAMSQIIGEVFLVLGLSPPAKPRTKAPAKEQKEKLEKMEKLGERSEPIKPVEQKFKVATSTIAKKTANDNDNEEDEDVEDLNQNDKMEIDDETLSKYIASLGGSSDEESFDEEAYKGNRRSPPATRLSLSPSPSLSPPPSVSDSEQRRMSISHSSSTPPRKLSKPSNAPKEPPKASTFLPTLMGGYWSGSESSASDLEDDIPRGPERKNRPGQQARRLKAERKFRENANHIKKGLGPAKPRVRGFTGEQRGRGGYRGGFKDKEGSGRQIETRTFSRGTGDNAMPVGERKRGKGKPDDTGKLHASWEAAKKAKMQQKTATFAGKKVVFD